MAAAPQQKVSGISIKSGLSHSCIPAFLLIRLQQPPATSQTITMDVSLPAGLPAGFPTALPAGLPTELPAGLPTALPAGFPTALPTGLPAGIPTLLPSSLPAVPSNLPAVTSSGAPASAVTPTPASKSASAAAPQPSGINGSLNCTDVATRLKGSLNTCLQITIAGASKSPPSNQNQADAAMEGTAKCSCGNLLVMKADILQLEAQCTINGQAVTDAEKTDMNKTFADCQANNFAAAAKDLQLYLEIGGKRWDASGVASTSGATAASKVSAIAAFAGLAAGAFFLA
ncbi:hypothetical protein HDU87_008813 [Geranomyces variabilis]|uniref:Uncharacterized protein n=1 Tax=Geranomyces variabilis TaxID=109894 RepID=A0AAD5TDN1_9FUNG|nr:hypothetical protein HDU87_008813 [Geranomyces variabilis]